MARVIVYSRKNCPSCTSAKQALRTRGVVYREIVLSPMSPSDVVEMFHRDAPGARTVPQILIGSRLIGGWDDLEPLLDTHEFQQMIGEK